MATVSAAVQVAILYFATYAILKSAKGSRFGQALAGIAILASLLAASMYLFHFHVLSLVVKYLLVYLAISTVVIFQPEIRRMLATMGAFGFLEKSRARRAGAISPEEFASAVAWLAERRIGALFAFERGISLRGFEETGVPADAIVTRELLEAVFTPPLPLHDGGAVVRNGRLSSAHCIFPVSNNPSLAAHGMRHRAAVGLTEETDALAVAVSEETGDVSVAHNGRLYRYSGDAVKASLVRWLAPAMPDDGEAGILPRALEMAARRIFARGARRRRSKEARRIFLGLVARNFWLKAASLGIALAIYALLAPERKNNGTTAAPAGDSGVFPLNRAGLVLAPTQPAAAQNGKTGEK